MPFVWTISSDEEADPIPLSHVQIDAPKEECAKTPQQLQAYLHLEPNPQPKSPRQLLLGSTYSANDDGVYWEDCKFDSVEQLEQFLACMMSGPGGCFPVQHTEITYIFEESSKNLILQKVHQMYEVRLGDPWHLFPRGSASNSGCNELDKPTRYAVHPVWHALCFGNPPPKREPDGTSAVESENRANLNMPGAHSSTAQCPAPVVIPNMPIVANQPEHVVLSLKVKSDTGGKRVDAKSSTSHPPLPKRGRPAEHPNPKRLSLSDRQRSPPRDSARPDRSPARPDDDSSQLVPPCCHALLADIGSLQTAVASIYTMASRNTFLEPPEFQTPLVRSRHLPAKSSFFEGELYFCDRIFRTGAELPYVYARKSDAKGAVALLALAYLDKHPRVLIEASHITGSLLRKAAHKREPGIPLAKRQVIAFADLQSRRRSADCEPRRDRRLGRNWCDRREDMDCRDRREDDRYRREDSRYRRNDQDFCRDDRDSSRDYNESNSVPRDPRRFHSDSSRGHSDTAFDGCSGPFEDPAVLGSSSPIAGSFSPILGQDGEPRPPSAPVQDAAATTAFAAPLYQPRPLYILDTAPFPESPDGHTYVQILFMYTSQTRQNQYAFRVERHPGGYGGSVNLAASILKTAYLFPAPVDAKEAVAKALLVFLVHQSCISRNDLVYRFHVPSLVPFFEYVFVNGGIRIKAAALDLAARYDGLSALYRPIPIDDRHRRPFDQLYAHLGNLA